MCMHTAMHHTSLELYPFMYNHNEKLKAIGDQADQVHIELSQGLG